MRTKNPVLKAFTAFLFLVTLGTLGCSDAKDLIDVGLNPPDREPIDISRTGVNNFFVNPEFGNIRQQFSEIRDTLGLKYVRVLFAWSNDVQPSPNSAPNYGFYDEIVNNIPSGIDVSIVLVHTPNWITNPGNWVGGNPRQTFVERWVRPTVQRYAGRPGIVGWEVWNEPDFTVVGSDDALGLTDPANYFELLNYASSVIRVLDPTKLVILGASRSIAQNFPNSLNYNKSLRDFGAENLVDVWNVHYYGKNFESVVAGGGVGDFLNSISKTIWITESGIQGPNNQLPYVEQVWPFLRDEVPGIDRIYYYEYGSTQPLEQNYGLKTTDPGAPVSDLYIYLRDN